MPALANDCPKAAQLAEVAKQSTDTGIKIAKLGQALEICPSAAIAYRLGVARLQEGKDPKGAVEELKKADEYLRNSGADNPVLSAAIKGRLAQAHYNLEQLCGAESQIKAALEVGVTDKHPWLWQLNAAILDHPKVRFKTAEEIVCVAQLTGKSVGSAPKVDLYITFDYDKEVPNAEGEKQAGELAKMLSSQGDYKKVLVIGHTDAQGEEAYNQRLSERRAEGVIALLNRIDPGLGQKYRFKPKGKGKVQLVSKGNAEADHRRNRRVEVQLSK
ncbi:MAG: OmpA family protein [Gammaproteobacteria bacterium]|nr:OmpA family protein [Gammaproteobacteria bacterium]MBU1655486.1 OmpA family protein [Gammaproteobacteria bacterium]MBU1962266.1 OmpA family protein [Gammaproteobacteria bacterium]